jgi:hypothetical protein
LRDLRMASTDSPLKRLVSTFITDFAAWLLKAQVREARPLNVELPGETMAVDQVFRVVLVDGRQVVLHIEFQGRRSHPPMPWRMLEYISRLAGTHRLELLSVVFYVGHGAGADDTGRHQVQSPTGSVTLSWQYEVIRLWQMPAEDLLALDSPALLALVGQTQVAQPEVVFPAVVARLRQEPDRERQRQLLTALLALITEEEWIHMVERALELEDELMAESPFLRRIQESARTAGSLTAWQRAILETLAVRFTFPEAVRDSVEQRLATITDEAQLATLHTVAVQSAQLADFLASLEGIAQG